MAAPPHQRDSAWVRITAAARRLGARVRRALWPDLGLRGERAAARLLKKKGYRVVARGRRTRLGELDLVAVDGRTVVFVEVKTRTALDAGHPAEAITEAKQRRLTRAALAFLRYHGLLECRARFDVVAVTWPTGAKRPVVDHIIGAFDASGAGQMFA